MRPTRAQLRREQAEDEADRLAHERPNEAPRSTPYTTCHDSVYLTHRFVPAHGGRRCAFCRKREADCLKAKP